MTGSETINSGRDLLKTVRQSLSFKLGLAVGLIFLVAVLASLFTSSQVRGTAGL